MRGIGSHPGARWLACLLLVAAAAVRAGEPAGEFRTDQAAVSVVADEKARPAQLKCPITGKNLEDVAEPVTVTLNGFKLRVADADAGVQAGKDPVATIQKLAANGDVAEPVSRACPVMGKRVNPSTYTQKDGLRIYVCCRGCFKRVENNWDAMVKKVRAQGVAGDPENLESM